MKLFLTFIFGLVFWSTLEASVEEEKDGVLGLKLLVLLDLKAQANLNRTEIDEALTRAKENFMDGSLTNGVRIKLVGIEKMNDEVDIKWLGNYE